LLFDDQVVVEALAVYGWPVRVGEVDHLLYLLTVLMYR
jgi:hypothetical protein